MCLNVCSRRQGLKTSLEFHWCTTHICKSRTAYIVSDLNVTSEESFILLANHIPARDYLRHGLKSPPDLWSLESLTSMPSKERSYSRSHHYLVKFELTGFEILQGGDLCGWSDGDHDGLETDIAGWIPESICALAVTEEVSISHCDQFAKHTVDKISHIWHDLISYFVVSGEVL